MRSLFPVIFSIILIAIFGVLQMLFFRFLNRQWWRRAWIRRAAWLLPLTGAVSVVLWGYGEYTRTDWLAYPGAVLAVLAFVVEVGLTLSLPVSGLFHFVNWAFDKLAGRRRSPNKGTVDQHRRLFLRAGAAAIPLTALAAGGGGVAAAMAGVKVYRRPVSIEQLPADLEGLKILHITDVHLRHYVSLDDLSEVLIKAEAFQPDITVLTGDIADDMKVLPEALRLVAQLSTPLGAYACLGNHEYFRGISGVIRAFERSGLPLFVNAGQRLHRGNSSLFIGGIDDPRSMRVTSYDIFIEDLDQTLTGSSADDFVVLMSHRPNVLDYAAERGVGLTLSGHTHGGQVGINNRSLFESVWPERYLWGHYRIKQSHLYTSSGVGHWFPFRLGCPPEAPVIELRRP
ncbi:MAG: metallophosphoesterase [Candidatus Zixiibacteriota bacterium]|nr:MAG: metallophosphoesterase [candidate division Zixibacteria bacterium]